MEVRRGITGTPGTDSLGQRVNKPNRRRWGESVARKFERTHEAVTLSEAKSLSLE